MLIDVETLIGRRQHFRLVDTVHTDHLQNLSLDEVTNTALSHYGNSNGCFDLNDQLGITHTCNAALSANIGWHTLQSHHSSCPGLLGNSGLLCIDNVADNPSFEHFWKTTLDLYCCCLLLHNCLSTFQNASIRLLYTYFGTIDLFLACVSSLWRIFAFTRILPHGRASRLQL